MKNGYKETEIGMIPEEWTTTTLEDISDFITKGATPTTYGFDWVDSGIYFFKSDCVKDGKFVYGDYKFISQEAHDAMERSKVKAGDILLSITGNIGKACRIPKEIDEANINQHVARVRVNKQEINDEVVFQWLCRGESEKKYYLIKTGQAYPQISLKQVRETIIPIPPVQEQKHIADILSTTDAHIERLDKLIADYQQLKKGMMKKLLTEGIGHTEFKETEIGRIPKSWSIAKLSEIVLNRSGKYVPADEESYPYIALENIEQGTGKLSSIGDSSGSSSTKTMFYKNDILFGKLRPYLKKYWLCNFDGVCSTEILAFKPLQYAPYVFYLIQQDSFIESVSNKAFGTKMPRTSWSDIKDYAFALPDSKEQHQISAMLMLIDKDLELLSKQHQDFIQLKKGLMEKLLTGKIRTTELKSMEG